MDGITDSMDMSLSKLQEIMKDRSLVCCKESETTANNLRTQFRDAMFGSLRSASVEGLTLESSKRYRSIVSPLLTTSRHTQVG